MGWKRKSKAYFTTWNLFNLKGCFLLLNSILLRHNGNKFLSYWLAERALQRIYIFKTAHVENNEYIAHVENTFLWHREHIPEYFKEKDLIQQKYDEETTHIKQTIQADIKQLQALF